MKFKSVLSILLLYGLYAHAQDPFERKLRFGIKAGVNGSVFLNTVEPFGPAQRSDLGYFRRFFRPSGFGGLTVDGSLSTRVSIGAEILFNSRGMAYRERNDNVVIYDNEGYEQQAYNYFNYNVDYLEFPITINYNFANSSSRLLFAGYAGIAPAIAVNYITKVRYIESIDASGRNANNKKATLKFVNHFNNSLVAGIKIGESSVRRAVVFGDFRTSYTLLPVFSKAEAENGNNLNTRMLTCSLGIGLKF